MANRATEGERDGNGHLVTLVFALVAALPTRNWYNEVTAPPSPKLGHYVGHVRIAKYSDLVARASRPLSRERPVASARGQDAHAPAGKMPALRTISSTHDAILKNEPFYFGLLHCPLDGRFRDRHHRRLRRTGGPNHIDKLVLPI